MIWKLCISGADWIQFYFHFHNFKFTSNIYLFPKSFAAPLSPSPPTNAVPPTLWNASLFVAKPVAPTTAPDMASALPTLLWYQNRHIWAILFVLRGFNYSLRIIFVYCCIEFLTHIFDDYIHDHIHPTILPNQEVISYRLELSRILQLPSSQRLRRKSKYYINFD